MAPPIYRKPVIVETKISLDDVSGEKFSNEMIKLAQCGGNLPDIAMSSKIEAQDQNWER